MNMRTKARLAEGVASCFILLFVYTAISKLAELQMFANTLERLPIIGSYDRFIAIAVPVTEILLATLLFFPKTRLAGFYGALLFISLLTGYLAYMIIFLPKLPCSCGGIFARLTWQQHLLFNIGMTLFAGLGIGAVHQSDFYCNKNKGAAENLNRVGKN